jgi:metal-responsive CopG/Arc/MetJ family transcriptional regulator
MKTARIVLDGELLRDTDEAARRLRLSRSALVREALREHLRGLEVRDLEERDRAGYAKLPQQLDRSSLWEAEANFSLGCDLIRS